MWNKFSKMFHLNAKSRRQWLLKRLLYAPITRKVTHDVWWQFDCRGPAAFMWYCKEAGPFRFCSFLAHFHLIGASVLPPTFWHCLLVMDGYWVACGSMVRWDNHPGANWLLGAGLPWHHEAHWKYCGVALLRPSSTSRSATRWLSGQWQLWCWGTFRCVWSRQRARLVKSWSSPAKFMYWIYL